MAENNVVFTNNTTKVLYPKEQHFWSGNPVTAPGRIPPSSTAQGEQRATAAGALKFATVYVDSEEELPTTRKFISAFDISFPQFSEYGPYGSQLPKNYSMILGQDESIKEIIVRHSEVVDAIGFVVADKTGTTTTKMFGGNGGDFDKISLKIDEYVTQISGSFRKYFQFSEVINRLTIRTNLNPTGYGPFGKETSLPQHNQRDFESAKGQVIGFFGKHDTYVESIGLFLSTGAGSGGVSKAYAESGPFGPIDWNVVEVKLGLSKPSVVYVDNILGSKVEATVSNTNGDATVVISDN